MNTAMSIGQNQRHFIDLFHKHYKFLCMIAMHHVKDSDSAEDIVQEFFIDFWEKERENTLKGSFEAYAARAVKYMSIDRIRSNSVQEKRLNEFGKENYVETEQESLEIDKAALQYEVLRLIEELPPKRKEILLMSSRDALSNKEIAEKLGLSIHTVKSQIVKAYAFIREHANQDSKDTGTVKTKSTVTDLKILFTLFSVF